MLRWMILAASFVLWAACMTLVYLNFKPAPRTASDSESQAALERLFDKDAPTHSAWKIYAQPADLEQVKSMLGAGGDSEAPAKKREWNGINEKKLLLAGRLETNIKNKSETSLNEETRLALTIPGTPFECSYVGKAHILMDKGLDTSRFILKFKYDMLEANALASGFRDGGEYVMNMVLTHNGQRLFNHTQREPVGDKAAANNQLEPFQYQPEINIGSKWEIHAIDFNAALNGDRNFIQTLKVSCVGRREIEVYGKPAVAFEVRSEKGEARAWYSANGDVLKQAFKLGGVFDIIIVREVEAITKVK